MYKMYSEASSDFPGIMKTVGFLTFSFYHSERQLLAALSRTFSNILLLTCNDHKCRKCCDRKYFTADICHYYALLLKTESLDNAILEL